MGMTPPRHKADWTQRDEDTLRELVGDGYRKRDIAAELGRTVPAVHAKMRALKLRLPLGSPPDPDKRARLLNLIKGGLSLQAVARTLGVRPPTVVATVGKLVRAGVVARVGPPPGPGRNPAAVRFVLVAD